MASCMWWGHWLSSSSLLVGLKNDFNKETFTLSTRSMSRCFPAGSLNRWVFTERATKELMGDTCRGRAVITWFQRKTMRLSEWLNDSASLWWNKQVLVWTLNSWQEIFLLRYCKLCVSDIEISEILLRMEIWHHFLFIFLNKVWMSSLDAVCVCLVGYVQCLWCHGGPALTSASGILSYTHRRSRCCPALP